MNENLINKSEIISIDMYSYLADGKKLWTSNLTFANIRAEFYGTHDVYIESVDIDDQKKILQST